MLGITVYLDDENVKIAGVIYPEDIGIIHLYLFALKWPPVLKKFRLADT